ncbi:MAG: RNA polymerase sigma-70 factor (ECF subfamily) [Verrucomicrobiales bacterium]|jgi:RNA polymerase sigma-70 factor (ECF subfamily)
MPRPIVRLDHFELQPEERQAHGEETADASMMDKERAERLRKAMADLPADQRIAIELAFLKGMTQTEVSEHLQQPLGTIKARIRRGMLKLQSSLQSHPDTTD